MYFFYSINLLLALRPGFLAGPSGIRAGRASNISCRLEGLRSPAWLGNLRVGELQH